MMYFILTGEDLLERFWLEEVFPRVYVSSVNPPKKTFEIAKG
jgi:hypothetical protein